MLREPMAGNSEIGLNPLRLKSEIQFPEYPAVPPPEAQIRDWAPLAEFVQPPYVCYRRLYFEQPNLERYGWDLGLFSPLVSQGPFYFDFVTLPHHPAREPFPRYECNTGHCLP